MRQLKNGKFYPKKPKILPNIFITSREAAKKSKIHSKHFHLDNSQAHLLPSQKTGSNSISLFSHCGLNVVNSFQGIRIIQSNKSFLLLNTLIYKATCFSSVEPSSGLYRRTDPKQNKTRINNPQRRGQ